MPRKAPKITNKQPNKEKHKSNPIQLFPFCFLTIKKTQPTNPNSWIKLISFSRHRNRPKQKENQKLGRKKGNDLQWRFGDARSRGEAWRRECGGRRRILNWLIHRVWVEFQTPTNPRKEKREEKNCICFRRCLVSEKMFSACRKKLSQVLLSLSLSVFIHISCNFTTLHSIFIFIFHFLTSY